MSTEAISISSEVWCQGPRSASECLETSNGCRDARSDADRRSVRSRPSETSNGCRDARSSVRCVKAGRVTVVGTLGRASVVSKVTAFVVSKVTAFVVSKVTASVGFNGDGRTTVRPYNRYSSSFDTTDAQPLHVSSFGDGMPSRSTLPLRPYKEPIVS